MRLTATLAILLIPMTNLAQPIPSRTFDLQGHRGCRGLLPENTIPAFLKALELGVNTLELDVVISQDKQVVVSHEPYMNAAFSINPNGQPVTKDKQKSLVLYQMPYSLIKTYDVGSNGNASFPEQQKMKAYKPLLHEVIEAAETYRRQHNSPAVAYNIEIKSEADEYGKSQPAPAEFCQLVYAVINGLLPPSRIIIQSFDFAVLKEWKKQTDAGKFNKVRLAALVENLRSPEKNLEDLGFVPDIYSPYYRLVGRERIAELHQKGIKVVPWTVNNPDDMRRLLDLGVDGLITDYPDRAKSL